MISFLLAWFLMLIFILFLMSHDNFWWIRSSPEFWENRNVEGKFGKWKGPIKEKSWSYYFNYLILYRLGEVFTDYRDLIPALTSSLALTFIIFGNWIIGTIILLSVVSISAIMVRWLK